MKRFLTITDEETRVWWEEIMEIRRKRRGW